MRPLSPFAFLFAAIVFTLTLLSASVLAPQDRYYRWQELTSGTTRKADWIYERLHFDPTPIDVALIGTSRTQTGLSGPDIEAYYCKATGRRIHIANLSVPETGRNMHYVIAKEAIRTKRPPLMFVELNDFEARKPHRNFVVLADPQDVLSAPLFINVDYFSDLVRLPGRQALLLFKTLTGRAAVRSAFDPAHYQGHDIDRTRSITSIDGQVSSRFVHVTEETLDRDRRRIEKRTFHHHFPGPLSFLEYRFSRIYLHKIESMITASGGQMAYVFLPGFKTPVFPERLSKQLRIDRPIVDLGGAKFTDDPNLFFNATHVNAWGAEIETARFAKALVKDYPVLGEKGCEAK